MLAGFFLILSFLLGLNLALSFSKILGKATSFFIAFPMGIVFSSWIALISIYLFNYLGGFIVTNTILFFYLLYQKKHFRQKLTKINWVFICYVLIWSLILAYLFATHMLPQKIDGIYSGGASWGDLALHSSLVNFFNYQNKLNLENPIYLGYKLNYPFIFDFYTALLHRFGFSLFWSFFITGWGVASSLIALLFLIAHKFSQSNKFTLIFSQLFLLNGGLGFIYFFKEYSISGKSLRSFLWSMPHQYAHIGEYNLHWSNIIADYFLPQRTYLLALTIFIIILFFYHHFFKNKKINCQAYYFSFLLTSLIPWAHVHGFLVIMPLIIWWSIFLLKDKKINLFNFSVSLLILMAISAPQLFWQFAGNYQDKFSRIQWGWMMGTENWLIFWFKNMGLTFFFALILPIYLFSSKKYFEKLLFFPLLILFIICNIIVFQPHDYDNMKFMLFAFFGFALFAAQVLDKNINSQNYLKKLSATIIFSLMIFTGILSVFRETYLSWKFVDQQDIDLAKQVVEKTSAKAIFLTSDDHNHAIPMIAGRQILMGYRGWLWTHGIDYSPREKDIYDMFQGKNNALVLLKKYRVNYVYLGPSEKNNFHANEAFFQQYFPVFLKNDRATIYEISL